MSSVEDILMIKGPDVIVADGDTKVVQAARMMSEGNVGSVIIKDDESAVGIFTERDLLRRVVAAGRDHGETTLKEVMTSPVMSCRLSDSVESILEKMTSEHVRHLAVIEEGALVGMVGLRDVLRAELRDSAEKIHDLRQSTEDS